MTDTAHTPTPRFDVVQYKNGNVQITDMQEKELLCIAPDMQRADRIVKAVNCHDELVEAVAKILDDCARYRKVVIPADTHAMLTAALAKAGVA